MPLIEVLIEVLLSQKQDSETVINCRGSSHNGEALLVGKIEDFGLTQRSVRDGKPIFLSVKVSLKKGEDELILY